MNKKLNTTKTKFKLNNFPRHQQKEKKSNLKRQTFPNKKQQQKHFPLPNSGYIFHLYLKIVKFHSKKTIKQSLNLK